MFTIITCEYELEGVYKSDATKPDNAPFFEFKSNFCDTGEIILYTHEEVKIKKVAGDVAILAVNYYLDNELLETQFDGDNFTSRIVLYDYNNHSFRYEVLIESGGNSIASNLGAEGFMYKSEDKIIKLVTNNAYSNGDIEITEDGASISWKTYPGLNMRSYTVESEFTSYKKEEIEINKVVDPLYFGEASIYTVYVNKHDGEKFLWAKCVSLGVLPKLCIGEKNNKIALNWKPSIYEDRVKEYYIMKKGEFDEKWEYLDTIKPNINFKILHLSDYLKFGASYVFGIKLVPNVSISKKEDLYISDTMLRVGIQSKIQDLFSLQRQSPKGIVYKSWEDMLFYDVKNDMLYDIFQHDNKLCYTSPNLKYIVQSEAYNIINLYDIDDHKFIKTINLKDISEGYVQKIEISDNGIIAMQLGWNVIVYDLFNERYLFKEDNVYNRKEPFLSPNGKFCIMSSYDELNIYTIGNNELTFIRNINDDKHFFYLNYEMFQIPDNDSIFYTTLDNEIAFWSYSDISCTNRYSLPGGIISVDYEYNRILVFNNGLFNIYDFYTGNFLGSIPTEFRSNAILLNNTIYKNGFKYYLPF
jgi:hypothetical protein